MKVSQAQSDSRQEIGHLALTKPLPCGIGAGEQSPQQPVGQRMPRPVPVVAPDQRPACKRKVAKGVQHLVAHRLIREFGASGFESATRTEERTALWTMRHKAYYAILALRPGARAIVTDICVPISRLAEAVLETHADISAASIPGPILGHVGDGNFHAVLLIEPGNQAELEEAKALAERMSKRALRLGGTTTGEHGIGMGKQSFMEAEHGAGWDVMGQIKQALDPGNLLNPGKVLRPGQN